MSCASFWCLHELLEEELGSVVSKLWQYEPKENAFQSPPVPNGLISTSVRLLAIALRYFVGGSSYNIMAKYGVSHTSVFDRVWIVVECVNSLPFLYISYPSGHDEQ